MTNKEAKEIIESECYVFNPLNLDMTTRINTALDVAIKALEQEPCEDEIILTKEEYGQLLSNEFDNGYAKGYREALEQDSVLNKIKAEIEALPKTYPFVNHFDMYVKVNDVTKIIDKYKAEMESEE